MIAIVEGWTKHLLNDLGFTEVPEFANQRASICAECPFNDKQWCKECGCFLPAKTLVKTENCRLGKWPQ